MHVAVKLYTKRQEANHVAETPNSIPQTKNKISCRKPPNFITTLEGSMGAHRACTFLTSARTGESRAIPEPFPRPVLTKFLGPERLSAQSGSSARSVPCPKQISLQARMAPPTLALLIPANPAQQRPIILAGVAKELPLRRSLINDCLLERPQSVVPQF